MSRSLIDGYIVCYEHAEPTLVPSGYLLGLPLMLMCADCTEAAVATMTQRHNRSARARAQAAAKGALKVNADAIVRPVDPSEWTKDEWRTASRQIRTRLVHHDRDQYPGRTVGPKDRRIKPLNTRRRKRN